MQAAEALFGEMGEHNRQAQALANLGDLHAARRQRDEAARWFEEAGDYMHLDPLRFAAEAMTRSKKIDYEKLRQRDPQFVAKLERAGSS